MTTHSRYYTGVPEAQLQRLADFRTRYPYRLTAINNHTWRYIDTGAGDDVLVALSGGTTVAELGFQTLERLARRWRVIAPDYPPVDTVRELGEGLTGLLDGLGIGPFSLLGGSYGGMMAHPLVRLYPDRVRKMVLAVAPAPNPESGERLSRTLRWLRFVPMVGLRAMLARTFSGLVQEDDPDPDTALLLAMTREIVMTQITRADILAAMHRVVDMNTTFTYTPDDLADWPGAILLLFGADDPATPPETRAALATLYPQAQVRVFEGSGHAIAITRQAEYFATIEGFLGG